MFINLKRKVDRCLSITQISSKEILHTLAKICNKKICRFLSLLGYSLINDDIETVTQIQLVIYLEFITNHNCVQWPKLIHMHISLL